MKHFQLKLKSFLVLSLITIFSNAQIDNEFWFAAPDIAFNHGPNGAPLEFVFTAQEDTEVRIERPADGAFTPVTIQLGKNESEIVVIDKNSGGFLSIDSIECSPTAGVQDNGFKITSSSGKITAYYKLTTRLNREFFSLKGLNAVGKKFTITTQNKFNNNANKDAYSGFAVVAREDNTSITVDLPVDYFNFVKGKHTITLNKGQTVAFAVKSKLAADHPQGVPLTSDKPVAVTIYDDSLERNPDLGSGKCSDTFGDQIVPDRLLGKEYFVIKGHLGKPGGPFTGYDRREILVITAIENNTKINVEHFPPIILNAGQVNTYIIDSVTVHIKASKPISVNQVTGIALGCEQAGCILPTIDACVGSNSVSIAKTTYPGDYHSVRVVARTIPNDYTLAANNFTLTVNDADTYSIPPEFFDYTADSSICWLIDDLEGSQTVYRWFRDKIPVIDSATTFTISNPEAKFQLGILDGLRTNGGYNAYFSDYSNKAFGTQYNAGFENSTIELCDTNPISLTAYGGLNYEWNCVSHPSQNNRFSDRFIASPSFTPDSTRLYEFEATIKGNCPSDIKSNLTAMVYIRPSSDFTISQTIGCGEIEPTFENKSDTNLAKNMIWRFEPSGDIINHDAIGTTFTQTFKNTGNTTQEHIVSLFAYSKNKFCEAVKTDTITLFPVNNDILSYDLTEIEKNCDTIRYRFNNTSENQANASYEWDFGNGVNYSEISPAHSFSRSTKEDLTYNVILTAKNKNECPKVFSETITASKSVAASFLANKLSGCTPVSTAFVNTSKGDLENCSYAWLINADTVSRTTDLAKRNFTTGGKEPTLYPVTLVATLDDSCISTVTQNVEVVPYPTSTIIADVNDGKSPLTVSFTGKAENHTSVAWDFGDGTSNSGEISPKHTFTAETNMIFEVKFTASNKYCGTTITKDITVLGNYNTTSESASNEVTALYHRTDQRIVLEFGNTIKNARIAVYNVLGNMVYQSNNFVSGQSIDMSMEQSGIYFLTLQGPDSKYQYRFIKQE